MRSRLLVLLAAVSVTPAASETLQPLTVQDATLVSPGRLEIVLGTQGRFEFRPLFRDADRNYEWTTPTVGVNAGLGTRAEAQFEWDALAIDDEGRGTHTGTGDARFATKVRVFSEGEHELGWLPALALRFGLKLPNASRPDGLGTDETDVFGDLLLAHSIGPVRAHASIGVGILGNPGPVGGQDDVLLYGFGLASEEVVRAAGAGVRLFAEVSGIEASRFDNARHHVLGGARLGGESLAVYAGAGTGLNGWSGDFLVRFGLVYRIRLFTE